MAERRDLQLRNDAIFDKLEEAVTVSMEPLDNMFREAGMSPDALAELESQRAVNVWSVTDLYFGGVHAVATDGDHAADPRRGGRSAEVV